jgi:hypothetical protein
MPNTGQEHHTRDYARKQKLLCYRFYSRFGIGIELALSWLSEAAAI